jgi:hypothetical protein
MKKGGVFFFFFGNPFAGLIVELSKLNLWKGGTSYVPYTKHSETGYHCSICRVWLGISLMFNFTTV